MQFITFSLLYSNVLTPCRVKELLSISRRKKSRKSADPVCRAGTKSLAGRSDWYKVFSLDRFSGMSFWYTYILAATWQIFSISRQRRHISFPCCTIPTGIKESNGLTLAAVAFTDSHISTVTKLEYALNQLFVVIIKFTSQILNNYQS